MSTVWSHIACQVDVLSYVVVVVVLMSSPLLWFVVVVILPHAFLNIFYRSVTLISPHGLGGSDPLRDAYPSHHTADWFDQPR